MSHLTALNMKTKKLFSMLAIALMMVVSTPLLGDVDEDPVYDLGEVTITCSGKVWGRCYRPVIDDEYNHGNIMEFWASFRCQATGDMNDNCSWALWAIFRSIDFWCPSF
jgi:hypothetical protein